MTSAEFQQRCPKPWHLVAYGTNFSLRAANGAVVGYVGLSNRHPGIPQSEWNRHVAAALREYLAVLDSEAPKPEVIADSAT